MLNMVELRILAGINMDNVTMSTSNHVIYHSTAQAVLSLVGSESLLRQVQLTGGKPLVFQLIICDPLHQILRFSMNDAMVSDCLDFVVFFTINFDGWCFVVQSIASGVSEEVDVKNVMKSL